MYLRHDCPEAGRPGGGRKRPGTSAFGERAEELGFVPLADAPAVELLEQIAALIATGPISSATINVRGRCKAKLTVSTKGKIKVSRSEVKSCDLEAGE